MSASGGEVAFFLFGPGVLKLCIQRNYFGFPIDPDTRDDRSWSLSSG